MARPKSFRELVVWQKAMHLARRTYQATGNLPKSEVYGLVSQMRRAAVSIASNIAEGHGRLTDSQFRCFLGNARGSLCELQTQLELAADMQLLDAAAAHELEGISVEVGRLINGLIAVLGEAQRAEKHTSHAIRANSANTAISANTAQKDTQ